MTYIILAVGFFWVCFFLNGIWDELHLIRKALRGNND